MLSKGMTVSDAAHRWVAEFNQFPQDMIQKLMTMDIDRWREITKPSSGMRVFITDSPDGYKGCCCTGEVECYHEGSGVYRVALDDGDTIEVCGDSLELEVYDLLPMWGSMWQFGDSADDHWLEDEENVRVMSECGFRIYESDEWGYFFGIDGCGYDFYEAHWIPLYRKRGLQWHDPDTEGGKAG